MEDFGSALVGLARDSGLVEAAGFPAADVEIEMADFKNNQAAFMQNELGMNPNDLQTQDGKISYQGKELDMSQVSDNLANGDIVSAFKDMGVTDPKILDNVSGFQDKYNETVKNSQRYKDQQNLAKSQADGKAQADALGGQPKDEADFEEKTKKMQKEIDDLQKKLEDDQKNGKNDSFCSGWKGGTKCLALGLTGVFSLAWLFKQVGDHACEMSGCWLVDSQGNKCKVSAMSCNDQSGSGNVCTANTIVAGADFKNACIQYTPNCTATGSPAPFGQPDPCCATGPAGTLPTSCSGGNCGIMGSSNNCSQYCDCKKVKCPSGYNLTCVNASFWDAWNDLGLPNPFAGLSGIFSEIIKIIVYVVLGLLLLVSLGFAIKGLFSLIRLASGKKRDE